MSSDKETSIFTLQNHHILAKTIHLIYRNLDETTRSVYKENVRINEALQFHMQEGEKLKKIKTRLDAENEELLGEKELNSMVIKEKVSQSKQQKLKIKEVNGIYITVKLV